MRDKAGDDVTTYERTFVGLVAEDTCRQDARERSRIESRGFALEAPAMGMPVPHEMREKYALKDGSTIGTWRPTRTSGAIG